ncbi:DNA recombination protein RmuC [Desulfosediminicola sp.]|uniref:DNA recombination protein RmuC n=1 Tax=Desulfosediminicola sp. TaxID=2886825 RepID=UPI003AF2D3FE
MTQSLSSQLQELSQLLASAPLLVLILILLILFPALVLLVVLILSRNNTRYLRDKYFSTQKELHQTNTHVEELEKLTTRQKIREARMIALIRNERRNSSEKLTLLEDARKELRLQFASLAQEIFEEKNSTFTSQSKERLESMLKPFHLQLDSLKSEIQKTYLNDTRERATLKTELQQLQELNRQMSEETTNLTRALKGDKKLQGNWGELILERVLEQSGLRRGVEYETQRGYRDEGNKLFKPDVIIHLPDEKDIIVDSKVSLSAWERYCASEDSSEQTTAMAELAVAIRNHIQTLGSKKYEELKGVRSLDFVLMFMPVEAAYVAAFQHDDNLYTEAFKQKIIIVTPTTLLATLRTIENIWRYEHQSRNSQEIARKAGSLYDKFRGFVEDMEKIGKQLDSCRHTHDSAMNKLCQGRGNLVSQAQQLTEMGVKVKKELPRSITELSASAMEETVKN